MVPYAVVDLGEAKQALLELQTRGVYWAPPPERRVEHFQRHREDLPAGSTLDDYEESIAQIALDPSTEVLLDSKGTGLVLWGRDPDSDISWFIKVGRDGEIWTAFPPENQAAYRGLSRYRYIGTVKTVLAWTQG